MSSSAEKFKGVIITSEESWQWAAGKVTYPPVCKARFCLNIYRLTQQHYVCKGENFLSLWQSWMISFGLSTGKWSTEDSFWIHECSVKGIAKVVTKLTSNWNIYQLTYSSAQQKRNREAIFIQNKKGLINISVKSLVFYVGRLKVYSSVLEQFRFSSVAEKMMFCPYSKQK